MEIGLSCLELVQTKLITNNFLNNIYIFKTNYNLNKKGFNNCSNKLIKKIKLKNKLKVFLDEDNAFKERLKK